MRRPARLLAAAVAAALALAACDTPAETPVPVATPGTPATPPVEVPGTPTGGTLRFAIAEPATVPSDAVEPDSLVVVDALFDALTTWGPGLVVLPAAASSWETTDDGRTWRFHLREGATFHDGRAVTAADFQFAWDLAAREGDAGFHLRLVEGYEAVAAGEADRLSGVDAEDGSTLLVRLREPYGQFPAVVAHPALAPVPRDAWLSDPAAFRRQPVGNGAFMAAEAVVPGRYLRVQRFDGWANGPAPAHLDEVLFQFMDPETAFVAFQQGRLQVSPLPEGAIDVARQRYGRARDGYRGTGVVDGDTPTVYFLGFDVTSEPFDDPEVRRAVSLAIDRERIAQTVLGGNVTPAGALVSPALSRRDGACEACVHDPEQARALLDEYGVDTVTLWFNRDGGHRAIAQHVRADLVAAGVSRVTFRAPPFEEFVEALEGGQAQLFRFGWQPEYPLPDDVLYPLFHSRHVPPAPEGGDSDGGDEGEPGDDPAPEEDGEQAGGTDASEPGEEETDDGGEADEVTDAPADLAAPGETRNYTRYADPEVDALLAEARATTSSMRRMYLHRRVEDVVVNRDQAVVPLFFYRHQRVVDERVVGFAIDPMGLVDLHRVLLLPDTRDPGLLPTPTTPPSRLE